MASIGRTNVDWDLIVVGGGAAGLWAAGTAAQRSLKVLVVEKNRKLGVKILMSGGTRCNITHACDIPGIMAAFGSQGRFLKPALHELSPRDVVEEMQRLQVATKVEETGKVFPVSNRAVDVRDALVRRAERAGAKLRSGVTVQRVRNPSNQGWEVDILNEDTLRTRKVLLCCGGLSYAGCGTTGDGYAWARESGHTVVPAFPALTPLLSPATWVHQLRGITLADVQARVVFDGAAFEGKRKNDSRLTSRGGFLWTHFGCSGPVPMNVSRFVSALAEPWQAQLEVDLIPAIGEQQLTEYWNPNLRGRRSLSGILHNWIPRSLAARLMHRAGVADGITLAELPKAARRSLVGDLKRLRIPLSGTRGFAKAEVTRGGVHTKEVNPHTMESRMAPGLHLAGEILDIDGPIGGYNFQAAFSTGHAAALHV